VPTELARRSVPAGPILLAICLLPACGRWSRDPARDIAAEIGGRKVTVAELDAYLDANLPPSEGAEAPSASDLDRVKSRLLDDFVDEEILYQESVRRGIRVSDAQLSGYLGMDAPTDAAARERARRDLAIQTLRESVVRAELKVDEKDIDAWLTAHAADAPTPLHGTLRLLRFASYPEATRVRAELTSGKLTFDRAEFAYGAGASPGETRDVDLNALPPELAAAVKDLKPGQVSAPVPFESSVLLFLLESIDDASAADARRRDRARKELSLAASEQLSDKLVAGLRARTPVRLYPKMLPFAYVAEGRIPGAQ
jgi:peptidyl-prolyl cis-trans isomerase SurA